MIIYPAIDILNQNAVRLYKGDYDRVTVYGTPLEMATKWVDEGSDYLHLVDLNGAKGISNNIDVIKKINNTYDIFIQVGGGIRTLEQAEAYLRAGVDQIILGTAAVNDPELLKKMIDKYRDSLTIGVDAKNGYVAVNGWTEGTQLEADKFIKALEEKGVKRIVYTDISRDGTLTGPNFEMYKKVLAETNIEIIASGGISTVDDLLRLKSIGVHGVVIGKALYENRFTLKEVLC